MVDANNSSDKYVGREEDSSCEDEFLENTTQRKVLAAEKEDDEEIGMRGDYATKAAPPPDNSCHICGVQDHWGDDCHHGIQSSTPSAQSTVYPPFNPPSPQRGSNRRPTDEDEEQEEGMVSAESEEGRTTSLSASLLSSVGNEEGRLPSKKEAREVVGSVGRRRHSKDLTAWCAASALIIALISLVGVVALFVILVLRGGSDNVTGGAGKNGNLSTASNDIGLVEGAGPISQDNVECVSNLDCSRNGTLTCALSAFDADAPRICCASAVMGNLPDSPDVLFCADQPDGSKCGNMDTMCTSGFCVNSVCLSAKLEDGQACKDNRDCTSQTCALVSVDRQDRICCSSNYNVNPGSVCPRTTPAGDSCTTDDDCYSEHCISGVCVEGVGVLEVGEECIDYRQCKNQACGQGGANSNSSEVCCESGEMASDYVYDDANTRHSRQFCTDHLEVGEECISSFQCKNRACGQMDANLDSSGVCCESGETASGYVYDAENNGYSRKFCTMQPTSTYCGSVHSMCATGLCIDEYCTEEALEVGRVCNDPTDCKNLACGLQSANTSLPQVCCESNSHNSAYFTDDSGSSGKSMNYCTRQPVGTYCQSVNSMCASELCINEVCADEKLDVGQTCTVSGDCKSSACGLIAANLSMPTVCCESELTVSEYFNGERSSFCGSRPAGTFCGTIDALCDSGLCLNQTCSEKLENNEECEAASQCLSTACGQSAPIVDTPNVCCESGLTTTAYLKDGIFYDEDDDYSHYNSEEHQVCALLAVGEYCDSVSSACASGFCVNQTCVEEALDANKVCKRDRECKSGVCAHAIADASSKMVCCESGTYTSGAVLNGNAKVCGGATIGVFCYNLASMCEGGYCIGGTCADRRGGPSSHCARSSDCESNVCGLSEARSDAPLVCCESGGTVTSPLQGDPISSGAVCSQLKSGAYCRENGDICETGVCGTDGYCE